MRRARRLIQLIVLALAGTAAWAFLPDNIHNDDDVRSALYSTEFFQGQTAHTPLPPADARRRLQELALSQPQNADIYKYLSEFDVQLLDFPAAETHLRQYLQNAPDKDAAYSALEAYYHSRLQFDAELKTILDRAKALRPGSDDVARRTGAYAHYQRALGQIKHYNLSVDPVTVYQAIVDAYPGDRQTYLDYINYVKDSNPQLAQAMLARLNQKFPDDADTFLRAKCSLLNNSQAFELLDKSYQPLWDMQLVQLLDSYSVAAGRKGGYLDSLKDRLRKNPLDFDAVTRAFYSYHLAGNLNEAQQTVNDFRLLKEQDVREGKSAWSAAELYTMARFSRLLLNFDDEARYHYALYMMLRNNTPRAAAGAPTVKVTADDALYGLFRVLVSAGQRPLQLGAGNIDYYADIATADSNPGVLNGILSLIFNSADPASEWNEERPKVIGYYNRAQALRLIFITQRDYPASAHLPSMYRDALKIYEKYGMNDLIVQAGTQFFKSYPKAPEILDVGVAVADAYSRMNDHENEWKTYDLLLPIAATLQTGQLIQGSAPPPPQPGYESDDEETGDDESDEGDDDYDDDDSYQEEAPPQPVPAASELNYQSLFNRYVSSLTQQKNHIAVVNLYKAQISRHPAEEGLYENFASFLASNNLLEDEAQVYKQAIQQFKEKNWYEKLARWYLRNQRDAEFETLSKQIIDTFAGTEVASYLRDTVPAYDNPYRALYLALNQYAHYRFPYNLSFVRNILGTYSYNTPSKPQEWADLAAQYYPLDESIRNEYLQWLSGNSTLPSAVSPSNTVEKRFAGDIQVWRSHFEEAAPFYRELSARYPSDKSLNLMLADLVRSLGAFDPEGYETAAGLREHLALIEPSDSALWTTAGETMADIEDFDRAKAYWQNILKIDPQNEDRYLEVATILWDYYLFDDALATIEQARRIKDDPELFAYEAGAIQESRRRYDLAIAEYSKSLLQESESARSRLTELYRRPRLTPVVNTTLEQRLKENPQESGWWTGIIGFYADVKERDTARGLIARAIATLNPDEFRTAASPLKDAAGGLGLTDLQAQILQLEVTRAATELDAVQATLDLARFYEAQDQDDRAEATYRQIYTKMPRSAGVINELLSYYWRTQKYEKAFALYDAVIPESNANYRKQYLLESARRHVERKDYAPALAAAQELGLQEPMNADYFQLVAEIYAGQRNYAALADHYKQGLARVRDSKLPDDEKKAQMASMRRGIISADLILKDYTAALDQYIEILNRDAENTAVVGEVSAFAMKYQIFNRLVEYYYKAAQASSKDHRWPMMLGRLHFYSGDFGIAIDEFKEAIAIRPERTDLKQELAECYRRLGRYEEAITVYEKLYAMTYKDKRWLDPLSELNARLGNRAKAIELYSLSLPSDQGPMEHNFSVAEKALDWGMAADAVKHGGLAMKDYNEDLTQPLESYGVQRYTEALVRTGASVQALEMLVRTYDTVTRSQANATFDAETLRSAQYVLTDEITREFPALLKKYATGDQVQALDTAVFQAPASANYDWKRDLFLPMVRAAGMARAEEQLLHELVDHTRGEGSSGNYRNYRDQLRRFYFDRLDYAKGAQWLEKEWRLSPDGDRREDLAEIARAYRLAAMEDQELAILREYFRFRDRFTLQVEPVERYLELLYARSLRDELNGAADAGIYIAANYFIKHKDIEMATRAVDAIGKQRPSVWGSIQHAMLAREFRAPAGGAQAYYKAGLDLRPIGEQLDQSSSEDTSVLGDDWFYYATLYGQHLWWSGQKGEASAFLPSDLEGAPTSDARQAALGGFYLEQKDYEKALEHYSLSAEIDPQAPEHQNEMASAMYLLGRKDEALALWKQMIASPKAPRYELLLTSAQQYGFVDSVRSDVEEFLQKRIEQSGSSGLGTLIPQYLGAVPADAAATLISKWLSAAGDPADLAQLMLDNEELDPALKQHILRSTSAALKAQLSSASGNSRQYLQQRYVSWAFRYSKNLLDAGDFTQAISVSSDALENTPANGEIHDKLILLQCKALIRTGKTSTAAGLLNDHIGSENQPVNEDRYRAAYELLDAEGQKMESAAVRETMYERLIASGRAEDAVYAGLAGVKLEKNQPDDARVLLQRMIYSASENLNGFHTAAELMEQYGRTDDAIQYRQELAKRLRFDMKNLARLSQDLLKTGKALDAAQLAQKVLQSDLAEVDDRITAARVYAKAGGSNVAGPAEMQDLIRALRGAPPADAAAKVYYRNYRAALIEDMESPPVELLLAQKYLDPQDKSLNVKTFEAYRRAGKCDLAFIILDPNRRSASDEYTPDQEEGSEYSDSNYYYDYYRTYPVEELNLSSDRTRELALAMAECAEKGGEDASRIFYLRMALHHTADTAQKTALVARIEKAQTEWDNKNGAESQRYKVAENLGRQS